MVLMPEHSSPTLTLMVTYRVGSRNEVTGTTGATIGGNQEMEAVGAIDRAEVGRRQSGGST